MVISGSLSLFSLHSTELVLYRQKLIIDCIAEDEDAEFDYKKQIEEGNVFDIFIEM